MARGEKAGKEDQRRYGGLPETRREAEGALRKDGAFKTKNNSNIFKFSFMDVVWNSTSLCIHVIILSFVANFIYFDISISQKKDPTQLLRIYGTRCPLHLDPVANKQSNSM